MPILPIIDLLILMGWTSLFGAFALKAIYVSTAYRPTLFGLGPLDMVIMAGIFLLFSLALAARTWVKTHEARGLANDARVAATLDAYSAARVERRADPTAKGEAGGGEAAAVREAG